MAYLDSRDALNKLAKQPPFLTAGKLEFFFLVKGIRKNPNRSLTRVLNGLDRKITPVDLPADLEGSPSFIFINGIGYKQVRSLIATEQENTSGILRVRDFLESHPGKIYGGDVYSIPLWVLAQHKTKKGTYEIRGFGLAIQED